MEFEDLIKEFGLTVETINDQCTGSTIFRFLSSDGQYGAKRCITRSELIETDICDLEQFITEEVRRIFKNYEYNKKCKKVDKLLDCLMPDLDEYIPEYKKSMIREAFKEEDLECIYALMPKGVGRMIAMKTFCKYLEAVQCIRKS